MSDGAGGGVGGHARGRDSGGVVEVGVEVRMKGSKVLTIIGLAVLAACQGLLDPTIEVNGLRFEGSATTVLDRVPGALESFVEGSVSVRNVSLRRIQRTFDGGCFIRRLQAFREVEGERRLAWDSDRAEPRGCTDDLAIVNLAPGEATSPENWRFAVRFSEIRDSLPAGRYEIALWIGASREDVRIGAGEVVLD